MTGPRYFWVRETPDDPWEPAKIDGHRVYCTGVEEVYDLANFEVGGECDKPLGIAWAEFVWALGDAVRIPKMLDWISRRIGK